MGLFCLGFVARFGFFRVVSDLFGLGFLVGFLFFFGLGCWGVVVFVCLYWLLVILFFFVGLRLELVGWC